MAGLDNIKLGEALQQVGSGFIQLPEFQRSWVWDDDRIRALIATVTLDYPLGVIMTLECGEQPLFKPRPLEGTSLAPGAVRPDQLLLDGQQRMTSLYQALASGRPTTTRNGRGAEVKVWYYLDIDKVLDPEADREDAVIAVPESKIMRAGSFRAAAVDLTTPEEEAAERLFPLHLVLDDLGKNAWHQRFVELDVANWPTWAGLNRILERIANFQVPLIKLKKDTDKVAVCSVFERVNTGGVVLDVFELLTASYAGDRKYAREHDGEDFHLVGDWKQIQERVREKWVALWHLEPTDFLMALALVNNLKKGRTVGCKRKDLLDLPLEDYLRWAPELEKALDWCGGFLQRQGVYAYQDLPYRTQLVPLAAIKAVLGDRTDEAKVEDLIARWYWCGVFGELYGGNTESRFPRDLEQVLAWIDGGPLPDTVAEATFNRNRLDTMATRNSAAYKGMVGLLIKHEVVDWYYTDQPFTVESAIDTEADLWQIFPKAWAERNGLKKDPRITSIVNKTVLSLRAGRTMAGSAPAAYLETFGRESGLPGPWMDDVVATHLIAPKTLRAGDFDSFYANRAARLTELIHDAMGLVSTGTDVEAGA